LKLPITITTDKTVLELKEAIAASSDVAADRQRLIYSGEHAAMILRTHITEVLVKGVF